MICRFILRRIGLNVAAHVPPATSPNALEWNAQGLMWNGQSLSWGG